MKKTKREGKPHKPWISGGGLLFLGSAALICIGFSAWSIGKAVTGNGDLTVEADDLVDINQYFTFEGTPAVFEYTENGLVQDHIYNPSAPAKEGTICIPFQIDIKNGTIREHLSEGATGFNLRTILVDKNTNLDLFSVSSITNAKLAFNLTNQFDDADYTVSSISNNVANKESTSAFDLSDFEFLSATKVFFSVKYTIQFSATYFKTEVYDKLAGGAFRFSFKAGGAFGNV